MGLIGVFGGTFDPIHFGHLRVAHEVWEDLGMERIHFIPAKVPPHRPQPLAGSEDRLAMVRRALEGEPGFVLDTRELDREGVSYMADTLDSLQADYPNDSLCLILGMDAFNGFTRWHEWQRILETAHLVVTGRPGSRPQGEAAELLAEREAGSVEGLAAETSGRILFHGVTQLEISATDIRERVRQGRDPRFLLPRGVIRYLEDNELYVTADPA